MVRHHHHHPHEYEPSESSDTISPRVTLPFNEDTSYVYEPLPIPSRMHRQQQQQQQRPSPLKEDSTEYDEEASVDPRKQQTTTTHTRNDSTIAWISRRLYTSNGWRCISGFIIKPCSGALCSSRLCRYLYQGGHFTPLGRDALQVLLTICIFNLIPMFLYFLFDLGGLNVSFGVYVATMIFLVVMAFLLLTECLCALGHSGPPKAPGVPETPASAIICAYLPNEAEIIVETVEHFLNLEYEPGIQIILAYNTPVRIPAVEEQLEVLANRFPNLLVLCIQNSTSKAQNVNAALDFVVGDFVGVFDADHRPDLHSFSRAWRWLSNGYDIVQGRSVSRNPKASWMARMMAVEAECRFTVSEPGRTTRDATGFYHSNGYWKSPLLKRIGMVASMMAEDVDAGMMALGEGSKIAMDPHLISFDLSTTTAFQTWNQRIRLAQGWFQVSMRHCFPLMFSPCLGFRQKLGIFLHLNVREMFPWFSSQVFTLVFYWVISGENRDLIRPLLLACMTYLLVAGPFTALAAYCLCHQTLRNPWWFMQYTLFNVFVNMNAKGLCARMGHIKQALGENVWRVTPRSTKPTPTPRTETAGQTPQEAEVTAIGEPSMTAMTIQKVAQSTKRTMASVLEENRSLFQGQLERADRSMHYFSRQEEESVMIAKHKLYHHVQQCDWSYAVTYFENMTDGNFDNSQSQNQRHYNDSTHEEVRAGYTNTSITDDNQSQNKHRKPSWAKPKRVKTAGQRRYGSVVSESSSDSHSRGKASIMDWSFQNMDGDYSVSLQQRTDYNVPMSPANQSVSLAPSDQSDSIRTSDMSTSHVHQYKPKTTRFQRVFNFSRLLSGSVSSRETSEQSSSRNSLYSDFSKSIDENGPGAFWTSKSKETSNADDHSSSTISEVNADSQKVPERDIEEGLDENDDVKRIRAQSETPETMNTGMASSFVSSHIKKGFSLDPPPSSSVTVADMSFRPDPPLKERSGKVQKEGVQSNLVGQPIKEQYWKKRGRYWAANSSKSVPSKEKQHRIRKDPEASRNPQKRRHGDAPSEVGRIYTIEESQDDPDNVSDDMADSKEMTHNDREEVYCGDPPAEEMSWIRRRSGESAIQNASDSSTHSDTVRPDKSSNMNQPLLVTSISQLCNVALQDAPAEPPAECIELSPRREGETYQHVMSYEDTEMELSVAEKRPANSIAMINLSRNPSLADTSVDYRLDEGGGLGIESTTLLLGLTSNLISISANSSVSTYALEIPSDTSIFELNEKDATMMVVESHSQIKNKAEPPGCTDLQTIDQSSHSVAFCVPDGSDESAEVSTGCADSQVTDLALIPANMFLSEQLNVDESSKDISAEPDEIPTEKSHGSSFDHIRLRSESKCSSSMYSCSSNIDNVNQSSTGDAVDYASVDSSLLGYNDTKNRSGEHYQRGRQPEHEIIFFSESSDEHVPANDCYKRFVQPPPEELEFRFGEGDEFFALQQMLELEMDRQTKPTDSYDDVEADSSLEDRVFPSKSVPLENTKTQRKAFFKELSIAAAPDELSEGVSSKRDHSTFSNHSRMSTDAKVVETSPSSRASSSRSRNSTHSRTQTFLPFRPPVHIVLHDEVSISDSISDAGTTTYSYCHSQAHSLPFVDDAGIDEANDESPMDSALAGKNDANLTVLGSFPQGNSGIQSGGSVHTAPNTYINGIAHNLDDFSEHSRSVNSTKHKQDEYCAEKAFHKEALSVCSKSGNKPTLQSSENASDPPAIESSAATVASGHGDEKLALKSALGTNVQVSTSQSTTDEESVVSETEGTIREMDDHEHSTSWIQNLLDIMEEEIIFCDSMLPIERYENHEIPDLVCSNTGQDTLQTESTQSYDEENKTDDWLGDEVSTVDLTVS